MDVDLTQFYQVFFDESAEHLAEMVQMRAWVEMSLW